MDRKNYKNLVDRLRADKIKKSGFVASLLLDTFTKHNGQLRAAAVYEGGLCKVGEFKSWRNKLIAKKWLCYTEGEYSKHAPGKRLVKYINAETMASEPIATKKDIERIQGELDAMRKAVSMLIEKYNPPATKDKIQAALEAVK